MNDEYEKQFNKISDSYHEASNAKSKIQILEELIRLADSVGDIHGAFDARKELVECATFSGQDDKALVAFTWCLAQSDKQPDEFHVPSLLWQYKWILGNLASFVRIPKSKVYELQDDMQRRLLAAGYNLRPIHLLRWRSAITMGEFERAKEHMELWKVTKRDGMSDCEACEQSKLSYYFSQIGELERSVQVAEDLVKDGLSCGEVPESTYGDLVQTYMRLGRVEELKANRKAWYKMVKDNESFLIAVTNHLLLAIGLGDLPTATALFEKHAIWAIESPSDNERFEFYNAAGLMFNALASTEPTIRIKVPDGFPFKREDHSYGCTEVAGWFQNEANELASRFDQRNGNSYFADTIEQTKVLVQTWLD